MRRLLGNPWLGKAAAAISHMLATAALIFVVYCVDRTIGIRFLSSLIVLILADALLEGWGGRP